MPRVKNAPAPKLVSNPMVPHAASDEAHTAWSWNSSWEGVGATVARTATTTATFAPLGYEKGYRYPLIVWLHGEGSSEHDLPHVMRHVSLRNYLAVAPRGFECLSQGPCSGANDAPESFTWEQTADGIDRAEEAIAETIETAAERFNLNENRVFIAGHGVGGTMALRLGLRRPEWFAGAATFNGPMPQGCQPLARVNDSRALPLLLSSGRESESYPEGAVCRDLALLHSAGCQLAVRQYPGDDDLTTAMLADLDRWAMEIVCG